MCFSKDGDKKDMVYTIEGSKTVSGGIFVICKRKELIFWTRALCSCASGLHRWDSNWRHSNLEWAVHNCSRKELNALEENGLSAIDKRTMVLLSWSTFPSCCSPSSAMLHWFMCKASNVLLRLRECASKDITDDLPMSLSERSRAWRLPNEISSVRW